jgi:hypothetical protein
MYREPGDDSSVGIGLLAREEKPKFVPGSRLSHAPQGDSGVHNSYTPTKQADLLNYKAADLIARMNEVSANGVKLPRI